MKKRVDLPEHVAPYSCACCTKCWIITKGKAKGSCIYGGPFDGYERDEEVVREVGLEPTVSGV